MFRHGQAVSGCLLCVWSFRPSSPLRLPHHRCLFVFYVGFPHGCKKGFLPSLTQFSFSVPTSGCARDVSGFCLAVANAVSNDAGSALILF